MIRIYFLFIVIFILSGCSLFKKDKPTAQTTESSTTATLVISTDEILNPNISGESTPVEVQIVYLKENSKMENMYYDELATNGLESVLGKTYIDHQDYSIKPNQLKSAMPIKVNDETNYIGVIAHFADIENVNWYKIIPVDNTNKKYTILVQIAGNEINLKKEEIK